MDGLARLEEVEVTPAHRGSRRLHAPLEVAIATLDGEQDGVLALVGAVSTGGVVDGGAQGVGGEGDAGYGSLLQCTCCYASQVLAVPPRRVERRISARGDHHLQLRVVPIDDVSKLAHLLIGHFHQFRQEGNFSLQSLLVS